MLPDSGASISPMIEGSPTVITGFPYLRNASLPRTNEDGRQPPSGRRTKDTLPCPMEGLVLRPDNRRPLVLAIAAIILAAAPVLSSASDAAAGSGLRVVVSCYSNPERVRVTNVSSHSITVTKVGSIYQPTRSEPYSKTRNLGAGDSITFFSGPGASSSNRNTLTRNSIFNNDVGSAEGARVKTSTGARYTDRCG